MCSAGRPARALVPAALLDRDGLLLARPASDGMPPVHDGQLRRRRRLVLHHLQGPQVPAVGDLLEVRDHLRAPLDLRLPQRLHVHHRLPRLEVSAAARFAVRTVARIAAVTVTVTCVP